MYTSIVLISVFDSFNPAFINPTHHNTQVIQVRKIVQPSLNKERQKTIIDKTLYIKSVKY